MPLEKQHDIDFPDALPGGEWILFSKQRSANWDDGQIVAKSLTTGEQRVVLDGGTSMPPAGSFWRTRCWRA